MNSPSTNPLSPASPDFNSAMKTIYDSVHPPRKNGKGSWTANEDRKLIQLADEFGHAWKKIATSLVGRNGKQCRERFVNHLDVGIKKGAWSEEENKMLQSLQSRYGNKWAYMSTIIRGRTACEVKNRFNAMSKRTQKQNEKLNKVKYSRDKYSMVNLAPDNFGYGCEPFCHV